MRPALLLALPLALAGCKKSAPNAITAPFEDDFNRAELGPNWESHNPGAYKIDNGQLHFKLAHNNPLWLKRSLPRDVRIDFDCAGLSPAVDTKVEVFGDGQRHESDEDIRRDAQYTASGYVFILGGWNDRLSTLVKQREHQWQQEPGVPTRTDFHPEPRRTYHWTILRKGGHIEWDLDGLPFLSLDDPNPLEGPGHDRFGFDGWEAEVVCDNLKIAPL